MIPITDFHPNFIQFNYSLEESRSDPIPSINIITELHASVQIIFSSSAKPLFCGVRYYNTKMSLSESTAPLLLRLVSEACTTANTAGSIVRKVLLSGELGVVDKGVNDLQTKADRCAQQYIVQRMKQSFPKATIIGEEGEDVSENLDGLLSPATTPSEPLFPEILTKAVPEKLLEISEDNIVIWVDPLDGTQEFTKGLVGHVTTLIGIAFDGRPVGGVIHQPFYEADGVKGRTMYGIPEVGHGVMHVSKQPWQHLQPDDVLRVGGAGHKAVLLIEGRAHAYVFASPGCKKWDTCAPEAVLVSIGGVLTDMDGKPYRYSKDVQHVNEGGLLATAPGVDHSWYLKSIPK
ncbi:3'(2'),5'-bisphosphate nucleotidase 1 [Orchesella cincta]|uniref:3'(2'),5'-bisphosphate nucleotidase 1 n=1 Tax=Orchesella cincta TaxID=48709 RepID=A0A1D2NAP9_ORCCI|nr:3'(2'),5'-bisphosphate nucleotidase 1 [Orchesella cincta]